MIDSWHIFIFSFNRGIFLEHCLKSIQHCNLGIEVTVIDDNSDDAETQKILNRINADFGFQLVQPDKTSMLEKRLGGLYANMNLALSIAKEKNKKNVLYIQDDMQFVRKMTIDDLITIEKIFNSYPSVQQVQTCFLKKLNLESYSSKLSYQSNNKCYLSDNKADHKSAFSDVGVFNIARVEANHGTFIAGESKNNSVAVSKDVILAQLELPFMMWLPYSTSYKSKKLKLKTKIIEFMSQCKFYPINFMSENKIQEMTNSTSPILPLAEDWLTSEKLQDTEIWCFSYGLINLFARGGWRKKLAILLWRL